MFDELDQLGDDAEPMHVLTLGKQVDIKGLLGGTPDSDRAVRYLCKYLTKSIADTYTQPRDEHNDQDGEVDPGELAYERHIDRLHREVRWLPCSPACATGSATASNPKTPGSPSALGGRRVLVSRQWSGKTLTPTPGRPRRGRAAGPRGGRHRRARRRPDGSRRPRQRRAARFVWEDVPVSKRDYTTVIAQSLRQAQRWRVQYEQSKVLAAQRGSPPVDSNSAIARLAATAAGSPVRGAQ